MKEREIYHRIRKASKKNRGLYEIQCCLHEHGQDMIDAFKESGDDPEMMDRIFWEWDMEWVSAIKRINRDTPVVRRLGRKVNPGGFYNVISMRLYKNSPAKEKIPTFSSMKKVR